MKLANTSWEAYIWVSHAESCEHILSAYRSCAIVLWAVISVAFAAQAKTDANWQEITTSVGFLWCARQASEGMLHSKYNGCS